MSAVTQSSFESNRGHCSICDTYRAVEQHHWQYRHDNREEITITVCRECHEALHVGARPRDYSGYAWLDACVSNLIELDQRHNNPDSIDSILERYGLPEWYSFDFYDLPE